jgi:alkylated DNA repair dioxygenase AlkB
MLDLFGEGESPDVDYRPTWLCALDAAAAMTALCTEVNWRQEALATPGGRIPLPRLTAWQGDEGAEYVYSGIRNHPAAWTQAVARLRELLQATTGVSFNSVLLNRYRGGDDSIGWHADDEPELGPEPVIASVSLGATRTFELRHRKKSLLFERFALSSGSLLVMRGQTQQLWHHRVPKEPAVQGERINLTFRLVAPRA